MQSLTPDFPTPFLFPAAKPAAILVSGDLIFGSDEYHRVRVNALFEEFMDRPADAGAYATFATAIDAGATDQLVISQLLSSDEYFAKCQV
ncbi:MAG TPA: hypothetical protein VFI31_02975 [Pirellulales bacterium]|nr:hypothetical protein [Pirellulales bacterium]